MACDEDESIWMNFLPLKRRKIEKDVCSNVKKRNKFLKTGKKPVSVKTINSLFDASVPKPEVCPSCQVPFTLIVPSEKHQHVSQCLDVERNNTPECAQGIACKSANPSHFKDFTHFQLAEFRATLLNEKYKTVEQTIDIKWETLTENTDNKRETLSKNTDNEHETSTENIDESLLGHVDLELGGSQKENDTFTKDNKQLDIRMFIDKSCNITARNNAKQVSIPSMKKDNPPKQSSTAVEIKQTVQWENRWWQNKTNDQDDTENRRRRKKECPFYKKIPDTSFAVDAFSYGEIPNISVYFLTHFHSDHYRGLNGRFSKPIYCSQVTANLINMDLRVSWKYINVLALNTSTVIDGTEVTFLEANHCPGSVLILYRLSNGKNILHTGDFRAHEMMESYDSLRNINIDILYLDTTYCQPKYDFPSQEAVVNFSINLARRCIHEKPKTLFVCGSYTIGKEKIFMGIAKELQLKVYASPNKLKILTNLEEPSINEVLAKDWRQAQVHVLSMQQLSYKALHDHLQLYNTIFTNIVAIKPTGWEYKKNTSLDEIKPRCSGNVIIYGIPYSEHSSFLELRRFVQFVQPHRIIPTVNMGKIEDRDRMQECFRHWIKESKLI